MARGFARGKQTRRGGGGRGRGLVWNRRDGIGPAIRHENRSITGTCYYGERSFPFSLFLSLSFLILFFFSRERSTKLLKQAARLERIFHPGWRCAAVNQPLCSWLGPCLRYLDPSMRDFALFCGREEEREGERSWEVEGELILEGSGRCSFLLFNPWYFFGNVRNSVLLLLLLREYYFDSRIFVSSRRDIYIDPKRRLSVFEHRTGIEYFLFLIIFE